MTTTLPESDTIPATVTRPAVTLTVIARGGYSGPKVYAAVLCDGDGNTKSVTRAGDSADGELEILLRAVTGALNALHQPAKVKVICNQSRCIRAMKRAGGRINDGLDTTGEYAAYVAASEPHRVRFHHAAGDAMGEPGRVAYQAATRRLESERAATPVAPATPDDGDGDGDVVCTD